MTKIITLPDRTINGDNGSTVVVRRELEVDADERLVGRYRFHDGVLVQYENMARLGVLSEDERKRLARIQFIQERDPTSALLEGYSRAVH